MNHLFNKGKIGNLQIKNRIVMAPMGAGGLIELDGRLSQRGIEYYAARAAGGTGLIITGVFWVDVEIEPHLDQSFSVRPRLDSPLFMTRLEELVNAVHVFGTKLCVQISPGKGRTASAAEQAAGRAVAPSPIPCFWPPHMKARELTIEEVEKLVKAFGVAAGIAKSAGADAVELHGHEGYLMDEFTTSLWNKRTDRYGGDLMGRLRFPLEIIKSIQAAAGSDFPIVYKFGATHKLEGGREIEESCEMAKILQQAGIAAFEVDEGCYETLYWAHPPAYMAPGCYIDGVAEIKKAVDVPIIAVGKLGYPELAEEVIRTGKADFIGLGRPLLADPEWPVKVQDGKLDDIRICTGCQDGCLGRTLLGKYLSCAINPATGMERELALTPAQKKKSVLVIGGGPAGMEAARVAALRGHRVTILEKSDKLGGNLIPASVPDFKRDLLTFREYLSNQVRKLGVDIRLMTKATPNLVQEMMPDEVIIATGSTQPVPDYPGVPGERLASAADILLGKKETGSSVVVMGGDQVGCETALWLARKGKKVTVIETSSNILQDMPVPNKMMLVKLLDDSGVKTLANTKVADCNTRGITIRKDGKPQTINFDTLVIAVGRKAERKLVDDLDGKVPSIHDIGDCVKPRKVMDAIWEAYRIARII